MHKIYKQLEYRNKQNNEVIGYLLEDVNGNITSLLLFNLNNKTIINSQNIIINTSSPITVTNNNINTIVNHNTTFDRSTGKQFSLEQNSFLLRSGYLNRWWSKPFFIYYYNKQAKEIKRSIELITKTYGTHNYNPLQGQLKYIDENGIEQIQNQNDTYGLSVPLGIRDFRTTTDISMKFNRDGSPYVNGLDGTDQYGVPSTSGEDPAIQLATLDIDGSILPKNKKRAIKILDFYNKKSGTGIISKENDAKIWKIYTSKRYVRLNYFALKFYKLSF